MRAWNNIVKSGVAEDFPDFPSISEEYMLEKLKRDPRLNPEGWIIALDNNEPCGLITVDRHGELGDLMVSKTHRRLGIGTALVRESLKFLRNQGFEKATLRVRKENKTALDFYTTLGFKIKRGETILAAATR